MFQGKIEASEVVQSLKILGINISEKQAEKILQRSGIILFLRQPYLPRIVNFYIFLFQGGGGLNGIMALRSIWFWEENVALFLCKCC